jgi:hypothetical protein
LYRADEVVQRLRAAGDDQAGDERVEPAGSISNLDGGQEA